MDNKRARVGARVTWGTKNIEGKVTMPPARMLNPETGKEEPFARCELTKPYTTPCGAVFPRGTVITVPVRELKELS